MGSGERRIEINRQTVADSFQEDAAHGPGKMVKQ